MKIDVSQKNYFIQNMPVNTWVIQGQEKKKNFKNISKNLQKNDDYSVFEGFDGL